MDTYVKYLYAHQSGDNAALSFTGEEIDFQPIESHRVRAGFRYNKTVDANFTAYGGLAYEYEFSNKAAATTQGLAIAEPDLKGGTGVAELGVSYKKAGKPWAFNFTVIGTTGKRESIGANLTSWYEFGKMPETKFAAKAVRSAETEEKKTEPRQKTAETKCPTRQGNPAERFETLFGDRRSETEKADRKTSDVQERQRKIDEQLTTVAAEQKQAENKAQGTADVKRKGHGVYDGTLPAYVSEKKNPQIEEQRTEKESRSEKAKKMPKPGYDVNTGEVNGIGVLEPLLFTTQDERLAESAAAKEAKDTNQTKETKKQAYGIVQIGASQNKGACEGLAAKAKKAGFDAKVTMAQKGSSAIYRVRVFSDSQTPEALLKQVRAKGFDGFAVKD